MRVNEREGPSAHAGGGPGRRGGFETALREAEGRGAARAVAERRSEAASAGRTREARGAGVQGRRATPAEARHGAGPLTAAGAANAGPVGLGAPGGGRGLGGAGVPGGPAAAGDPGGAAAPGAPSERLVGPASAPPGGPATVTLALAVRALVPAVEAFRREGREALSLDFGRALGVEVRAEPGGVTLTLAAAPGLLAAARAELPGLLRTLAARGVTVVRAEARERGGAGRGR